MKRAQKGDSPEKQAGRHTPPEGVIDKMLRIGGVERESPFRAALRAHPNALPAVATRPDVSPVALRLVDTALGILLEAGYSPEDALTLFHATSCFVVGHALDESGAAEPVAAEGYANLAAVAAAAPHVTPDATFEAGLAALLDSVADRR